MGSGLTISAFLSVELGLLDGDLCFFVIFDRLYFFGAYADFF